MKRFSIHSLVVMLAFLVGVTIQNSCGESPASIGEPVVDGPGTGTGTPVGQDPSVKELAEAVRALQSDVTALKTENAALKTELAALKTAVEAASGSGSNSGEFQMDGLWFFRSGDVASKPKRKNFYGDYLYEYFYDSFGRVQRVVVKNENWTSTSTYQYSGKRTTITTETIYKPSTDSNAPSTPNSTTTNWTEYY